MILFPLAPGAAVVVSTEADHSYDAREMGAVGAIYIVG